MKYKFSESLFLHVDADAFFASVEQSIRPSLKGKAVVVGKNGAVSTALSYEAKKMGVPRAAPIRNIRKQFKDIIVVASDYHMYRIFSQRMMHILSRHISGFSKKSIDECMADVGLQFADMTRSEIRDKLFLIAKSMDEKLSCGFSFGLGRTPLLAKIASSLDKPKGISFLIDSSDMEKILDKDISLVSGIGKQTQKKLHRYRIFTIRDLLSKDESWLEYEFGKNMHHILGGLQGDIFDDRFMISEEQKSFSRARTFPATQDRKFLKSVVSYNLEYVLLRMREKNVYTKRISLSLKKSDLSIVSRSVSLPRPSRDHKSLLENLYEILDSLYEEENFYRQVSVSFHAYRDEHLQMDLFSESFIENSREKIFDKIDFLENKFGKNCVSLADSLSAQKHFSIALEPDEDTILPYPMLPGESVYKRLAYPYIGTIN